ncbi:MAG: sulfurtransferase-like selenium metabolism protein YedF [Myxococcota bacterium]|nr:sulfurtransferase-like selenium metabolism protein YedF [Myxococcota bacterium]
MNDQNNENALIDARGLACPQPVVLTLKALNRAELLSLTTIVDNQAAVENVTRLAQSKQCTVELSEQDDGFYLSIRRAGEQAKRPIDKTPVEHVVVCSSVSAGPLVLFVSSESFGRGSVELGERLMGAFFHTLLETEVKPKTIIFMNGGVKLTVAGSRALEDIQALEAQGIEVLVCGTCLGYFELMDKLAVGKVSNMFDIATALLEAGRVVDV